MTEPRFPPTIGVLDEPSIEGARIEQARAGRPARDLNRQYGTADKLKDRIALHERFGDTQEDFHAWQFRQVQAPKDAQVLEIGCGSGRFWIVNSGRIPVGWELTLSDLSEGMLRESETNLTRAGIRALYRNHPATELPYEDESYDLIFANHMLYHVPDVPGALREARRVLRPGGRFYAATNGEKHMEEAATEFRKLLEAVPELGGRLPDISPFSMETGEELLQQQFDEVRLFERRDQLLVTEPEPFIRYVLSLVDEPVEDVVGPSDPDAARAANLTREQKDARKRFDAWRNEVEELFSETAVAVKRVSGFLEAL